MSQRGENRYETKMLREDQVSEIGDLLDSLTDVEVHNLLTRSSFQARETLIKAVRAAIEDAFRAGYTARGDDWSEGMIEGPGTKEFEKLMKEALARMWEARFT